MVSLHNNLGGNRAQDALHQSHRIMQVSLERLLTGVRINRAEDDAAGVMVRDRFQAQMNGFDEGIRNIQTAQGMIQVAEQGLNKVTEALQVMRALAVRAADDNLNDGDRGRIQEQIKLLLRELNERAERTVYNGHNLLNGSIADNHDERQAEVKIQTNSIIANGQKMVTGSALHPSRGVTTPGAVSQGSYEIKLVFDGRKRDGAVATTSTILGGTATSGNGYLNDTTSPVTHSMQLLDRDGEQHDVNITFTHAGGDTWDYAISSGFGGNWTNPIDVEGQVNFNASGDFSSVTVNPFLSLTTATAAGSKVNVKIADGTADGQNWAIDFSKLRENEHSPAVNTPNLTVNGAAGSMTTNGSITGNFDAIALAGSTASQSITIIDRTGASHAPLLNFQKTVDQTGASDNADTWSVNLTGMSGGAWSGATVPTNFDVEFDVAGNVTKVNGISGTTIDINIGDGTGTGQNVTLDFALLTNTAAATATASSANGTVGTPSTSATMAAGSRISSGHGPTTFQLNNVIDRTGTDSVSGASLTFTQVGTSNTWQYSVTAPASSGFTGQTIGGTGSVAFDEAGNLLGPTSFTATFNDDTAEGQQITFDITTLRMARTEDLSGTTSNGSQGTGGLRINAEIFYSGTTDTEAPVHTLFGVSNGAKTANLGGVSFTVNQVSSFDVGLTTYLKAYTYVSATTLDNALEFQIGPDEGQTQRIGIQKMDVQTLFRAQDLNFRQYKYEDVELNTTLDAQDLIGQLDDAINFVSGENLKVGQFQNNMTRTLDFQRQNNTSITNAYSLLNDADMAEEATNQSKRMIMVQSGTAMVSQSNTTSQFILQLLR